MRACRVCGRLYPDSAGFCPVDGQGLYEAGSVSIRAEPHTDPRVGTRLFGRYEIRRVVADGGMGRVYEALDTQETRHVAVKILHEAIARDPVAVARFRREFEVSRQMSSLHIVEVLDFQETEDGSFALIMEFLYGEELRATLKREGVLGPERVVRLLSQVAVALTEPHAQAIVHRDLKPDNLFLCQTPRGDMLKVLDFGSARDNAVSAEKLTVMGTTIGSPFYMPPEQAQALDSLDHRADVWALGVIAYECLTGTVPFQGPNGPSILLEILTKEPLPPSQATKSLSAEIPKGVDSALLHAMAKPVESRTASVGELATEVGVGFGLTGDFNEWATTPENSLRDRIANRLPALLDETTLPKHVGSIATAFLGRKRGQGRHAAAGDSWSAAERDAIGGRKPLFLVYFLAAVLVIVCGVGILVASFR